MTRRATRRPPAAAPSPLPSRPSNLGHLLCPPSSGYRQALLDSTALDPNRMPGLLLPGMALAAVLILLSAPALANPAGGQVVGGQATIVATDPKTLQVTQGSDRAIIDWHSFSIGADETTRFVQPSSSSVILNRVTGGDPSRIFGALTANGQVVLINGSGILFGATAKVDVAGLVASTADIRNGDFMAGRMDFTMPGRSDAAIVNKGDITVAESGLVALVAPGVENAGRINAKLGRVALASGERFAVDLYGDGLVSLAVGPSARAVDADGRTLSAAVANSGSIIADGGIVTLSAAAASAIVDNVINSDGLIQAQRVGGQGGEIVLDGGEAGLVRVAGTLDASSPDGAGGTVKALGERVELAESARLDASGAAGGGKLLVGGNWQGKGPERNARQTKVAVGATLKADAKTVGDGGTVVVWADGDTQFAGSVSARGGAAGGNGGQVETSGKQGLTVGASAAVDAGASAGDGGAWLLDPDNLTIADGGGGSLGGSGDQTVDASVLETTLRSGTGVTLQATNAITVNEAINGTGGSAGAGSDLTMNAATVNLNAAITLHAAATLSGTASTVNVGSASRIQNGVDVAAAGAQVNVAAGTYVGPVTINKAIAIDGAGIGQTVLQANVTGAGDAITINNASNVNLSDLTVRNYLYGLRMTGTSNDATVSRVAFENNTYGMRNSVGTRADRFHMEDSSFSGGLIAVQTYVGTGANGSFSDALFDNVSIDGATFKGFYLETANNLTLRDVTITNTGNIGGEDPSQLHKYGHAIDINLKYGAYNALTFENLVVENSGHSSGDATRGAVVIKTRGVPGDSATYMANPASLQSVTFDGGRIEGSQGTGLRVETLLGGSPAVSVGGGLQFVNNGQDIVAEGATVNATGATFVGAADGFAIENRVTHAMDSLARGLVTWDANDVYVTTDTLGIQRGVNLAAAGDTVHVGAGTYAEAVSITKALTLDGAGSNQTIIDPASGTGITISGNIGNDKTVTISDLKIQGATAGGIIVDQGVTLDTLNLSGLAVVDNVGNGFHTANNTAQANLENINISDSLFAGNGTSSFIAADVNLYRYNGNASLTNVDILGTNPLSNASAGWGLQIMGGSASAAAGSVTLDDVRIAGNYRRALLGIQTFSDVSGIGMTGVQVGGAAGSVPTSNSNWGGLFFSDVGGAIDIGNTALAGGTYTESWARDIALGGGTSGLKVDANAAQFAGIDRTDGLSRAEGFAAEARVWHALDAAGAGLVRFDGGNLYVTAGNLIQRGIDAAAAGNTVNVAAGTYAEALTIGKALTLDGAGKGQTIIDPAGTGGIGIAVSGNIGAAAGVTISDLTVQGAGTGIRVADNTTLGTITLDGVAVRDNSSQGFISSNGGNNPTTVSTINILNSVFEGNGFGGNPGTADINIFRFNGTANLSNVDILGTNSSAATLADYGLQIRGHGELATMTEAGNVTLNDVRISGSYEKAQLAVQRYSDAGNIVMSDVVLGGALNAATGDGTAAVAASAAGWGAFYSSDMAGGLSLGNTQFAGGSFGFGDIRVGGETAGLRIDATDAGFSGIVRTGATGAENYVIENRVDHAMDDSTRGLVIWQAGNLYVTTNNTIQRGIAVASAGDTVNVAAGSYAEAVNLNKNVTLRSAGATVSDLDSTVGASVGLAGQWTVQNAATFAGAVTLADDLMLDTHLVNGNIAFLGAVTGRAPGGQDLTLNAGSGTVTMHNLGTSSVKMGDINVQAGTYAGSAGTAHVANFSVTAGDVAVGNSTVNASGNVALSGTNVSGSIVAATATIAATGNVSSNVAASSSASVSGANVQGNVSGANVTVAATQTSSANVVATNTASVSGANVQGTVSGSNVTVAATQTSSANVAATNTASVSGANVQGTVSGANVNVAATETANTTVVASNSASVSGTNVQGSVQAPTATVTATQTVNIQVDTDTLTVSAPSGSVGGDPGTVHVTGPGVLEVNNETTTSIDSNVGRASGVLDPNAVVSTDVGAPAALSPSSLAFNGGAGDVFSYGFSLGAAPVGVQPAAGGEAPPADGESIPALDGGDAHVAAYFGDFWSYFGQDKE